MTKPITPDEVVDLKTSSIPDAVFDVFNSFIAQRWDGNTATVYQDDVMSALEQKGFNRRQVYDENWLDVEASYIDAGWNVLYDKPVLWAGENYRAHFVFSKKSAK